MNELREMLAAIEHEQWVTWAQSVLESEPIGEVRRERWARYMVPYAELDEATKDHDREWADRVVEAIAARECSACHHRRHDGHVCNAGRGECQCAVPS